MIKIIAAISKNSVIGNSKTNSIPWNYPEDMKHFRETTKDSVVIMGKHTYTSIGRLLPKRTNIIVSKTLAPVEGAVMCESLSQAIEVAKKEDKPIFVIGGSALYKEALDHADEIILTLIPETIEGDDLVIFPKIDMDKFKIVKTEKLSDKISYVTIKRNV